MSDPHLDGWLPYCARWVEGALWTDWARLGAERLDPAFFEHTVSRMLASPFNQLFGCAAPEALLRRRAWTHPGLKTAGFVFHLSRCGSTLIARLLAQAPRTVVLSEARPADTVLKGAAATPPIPPDAIAERLRWMLAALGQPRRGDERRLFVKLDAWQMCAWAPIAQAFPQTPWVFLYRDPVEVLVSQMREAGSQFLPGGMAPALLGLDAEACDPGAALEDHCAQVLAGICRAAIARFAQGGGLLVDYARLPQAFDAVAAHFGVELDAAFRQRAQAVWSMDAKRTGAFMPDGETKSRAATPAIRDAAERRLAPLYAELQRLSAGA